MNIAKFLRTFFYRAPPVDASGWLFAMKSNLKAKICNLKFLLIYIWGFAFSMIYKATDQDGCLLHVSRKRSRISISCKIQIRYLYLPSVRTFIPHQSEAVVQRYSVKNVILEISQNLQENTCARISFWIKLQTWRLQLYIKKRDSGTGGFLWIWWNF